MHQHEILAVEGNNLLTSGSFLNLVHVASIASYFWASTISPFVTSSPKKVLLIFCCLEYLIIKQESLREAVSFLTAIDNCWE